MMITQHDNNGELSCFKSALLFYLRESHPHMTDDKAFIRERADSAAEAYEHAIRDGLSVRQALELADTVLYQDLRFSRFNRFIMCQMEWSEAVIDRVDRALALTKNFHLEKVNQVLVELKAKNELRDDLDINMIQHIIVATYMGIVFSTLSKRADYNVADMVRAGLGLLFESIKRK